MSERGSEGASEERLRKDVEHSYVDMSTAKDGWSRKGGRGGSGGVRAVDVWVPFMFLFVVFVIIYRQTKKTTVIKKLSGKTADVVTKRNDLFGCLRGVGVGRYFVMS